MNSDKLKRKQADEAAIREWHKNIEASVNRGDFEAYGSFWTENMIWLPPNAPIIIGKESCLQMAREIFEHYAVEQKVTVEELKLS